MKRFAIALALTATAWGQFAPKLTGSAYRYARPGNGLIGYYTVSEGSGATIHNTAPAGPGRCGDITITGSTWYPAPANPWTPYKAGIGMKTTSDYLTIPTGCLSQAKSIFLLMRGLDTAPGVSYSPLIGSNSGSNYMITTNGQWFVVFNGGFYSQLNSEWATGGTCPGCLMGEVRPLSMVAAGPTILAENGFSPDYTSGPKSDTVFNPGGTVQYFGKDTSWTGAPDNLILYEIAIYSRAVSQQETLFATRMSNWAYGGLNSMPVNIHFSGDSIWDECATNCASTTGTGRNWGTWAASIGSGDVSGTIPLLQASLYTNSITCNAGECGYIRSGSEYIHLTDCVATSVYTCTLTRGLIGSTPAAHASGDVFSYDIGTQFKVLAAQAGHRINIVNGAIQGETLENQNAAGRYNSTSHYFEQTFGAANTVHVGTAGSFNGIAPRNINIVMECVNSWTGGDSTATYNATLKSFVGISALAGYGEVYVSTCDHWGTGYTNGYEAWAESVIGTMVSDAVAKWGAAGVINHESNPYINAGSSVALAPWQLSDNLHSSSYQQYQWALDTLNQIKALP